MYRISFSSLIVLSLCSSLAAQEQPEFPQPSKEHQWLEKFVGEWEVTSSGSMGPEQPAMECAGTITSHMLGGFWVVNEMDSEVMDAPMRGLQIIGYDTAKQKYIGTWVDSFMNHMWQYEGSVDDSGKKLSLVAVGPNHMAGGKITQFRDSYEFKSPDLVISTAEMKGDDGKWMTFMTGEMKRIER